MMLLWLSVAAVVVLLLCIWLKLTRNYNYWKKKGVNHLSGRLPFGNIADVFFYRKTMGQLYTEIYKKFEGEPWCGFYKMRQPILMVRDPDLVRTVLVREFNNFHDNDFHFNPDIDPILSMNPFAVEGERWKEMRAVLAPAQSPAKLKAMVPLTSNIAAKLAAFLRENAGKPLEMTEVMGHYLTDLMAGWGLGLEVNSFKEPNSEFRQSANLLFGGDFTSNLAIQLCFYAPWLGNILRFSMIRKVFVKFFGDLVKKVVEERAAAGQEGRADMVQLILDMNKEAKAKGKGKVMDLPEMTGHVLTFFSEGFFTSSLTTSFILHELAQNPDVQDKARQEIRSVASSVLDIDYDKLHQLTYLQQIIDETLRLHTTVPVMTRLCTVDTVLVAGDGRRLEVEAGTPVTVPVSALHRDPDFWSEPDTFLPERFAPGTTHGPYLGFSDGPRACVGIKIAYNNLKLGLAAILLEFSIEPAGPASLEPDPASSFVYIPKGGVWLKFNQL